MNIRELLDILLNRIVELEIELKSKDDEIRLVRNYLLGHGIILTHYSERLTSDLDKEEE